MAQKTVAVILSGYFNEGEGKRPLSWQPHERKWLK